MRLLDVVQLSTRRVMKDSLHNRKRWWWCFFFFLLLLGGFSFPTGCYSNSNHSVCGPSAVEEQLMRAPQKHLRADEVN